MNEMSLFTLGFISPGRN